MHAVEQRFERTRRFLARRLDASTYVGLHLTVSILIAAIAIWVSSALLDAVLDNATVVRLDIAAAAWVHRHINRVGTEVSLRISQIGSPTSMVIVAVLGGVWLLIKRRKTLLATWIAVFAGGGLLEKTLKTFVHRTRPIFNTSGPTEQSLSFPSGHTMMATIGVMMLVYVLMFPHALSKPWRGVMFGLATAFVLCVGISRVYLGAHYPSDVVGGLAFGTAWVAACIALTGVALHARGHDLSHRRKDSSRSR